MNPPGHDLIRLSQEVLRYLPSGVVFFDERGSVLDANPSARNALAVTSPQGMGIVQLFGNATVLEPSGMVLGPAATVIKDALRHARTLQRKTLDYSTPDGHRRRLGVTMFPLPSEGGGSGLICLLTDLTEIQALEQELQRRRSLAALGEMSAGIAHEFKNALATISGYAQMLDGTGLEPERAAHVHKILEQVDMLTTMATEFLTFARPLAVMPEPVDTNRLLRECVDAIRVQDFPEVRVIIDGNFPPVSGDHALLAYAFMNVLRNACEAIVQGGRGTKVELRHDGSPDEMVRILVIDDGPGVNPEVAEKIFIPFFTTKTSGSGLGLAMVHKIVTAHRGSVRLEEATAGRTVFALTLPAALSARAVGA